MSSCFEIKGVQGCSKNFHHYIQLAKKKKKRQFSFFWYDQTLLVPLLPIAVAFKPPGFLTFTKQRCPSSYSLYCFTCLLSRQTEISSLHCQVSKSIVPVNGSLCHLKTALYSSALFRHTTWCGIMWFHHKSL